MVADRVKRSRLRILPSAGFCTSARLKNLKKQRLYRPSNGEQYPNLQAILTRPINWEIIEQQYDELIKLTTALRLGTKADSILVHLGKTRLALPQHF